MEDLEIKWFTNAADRFIQLLKVNSWNDSVRQLKREKEERGEFNGS